jgi:alkanesulfonate monooxygenase
MSATAESSSTNGINGNTNGVPKSFTPVKQLDINQDPDRVLFA